MWLNVKHSVAQHRSIDCVEKNFRLGGGGGSEGGERVVWRLVGGVKWRRDEVGLLVLGGRWYSRFGTITTEKMVFTVLVTVLGTVPGLRRMYTSVRGYGA